MKVKKLNKSKLYIVKIEKKLEKLSETILFPKKLEQANQVLETIGIPTFAGID